MSAEGILDNPALFLPEATGLPPLDEVQGATGGGGAAPKPPSTTIVTPEQKELRKIAKKLREIQRLEASVMTPLPPRLPLPVTTLSRSPFSRFVA